MPVLPADVEYPLQPDGNRRTQRNQAGAKNMEGELVRGQQSPMYSIFVRSTSIHIGGLSN